MKNCFKKYIYTVSKLSQVKWNHLMAVTLFPKQKKKLFVVWHLCMYIVCYVNTLSDPVYRSNQTLKFFPVPRYKGHAFVLLAVVQKKIAITVTHTRLPLLNHQASVLHWKNLSGACLWQTVRAAVWGWLMWAVVEQSLW